MSLLHKIPREQSLPEYFWNIVSGVYNLNTKHNTFRLAPDGTVWLWEDKPWDAGSSWTNLGNGDTAFWSGIGASLRREHGDFDHSVIFISFGEVNGEFDAPDIVGPRIGISSYEWWE